MTYLTLLIDWCQVVLLVFLALLPAARFFGRFGARPPYKYDRLARGAGLFAGAGVLLALEQRFPGASASARALLGLAHMCGGGGAYFLWRALPCRIVKKTDSLPVFI